MKVEYGREGIGVVVNCGREGGGGGAVNTMKGLVYKTM